MPPKKTKRLICSDVATKSHRWSLREKQLLLKSIQKHGLADLNKLQADVKSRTVAEIQLSLHERRKRLQADYNRRKESESESSTLAANQSIIGWSDKVREAINNKFRGKDYAVVLQEIMEEEGKLEVDELQWDNTPNLSLLYTYVSRALSGCMPPSLPPLESWLMLHAWRSLTETVKQTNWEEEKDFLTNISSREQVQLPKEFRKLTRNELWEALNKFSKDPSTSQPPDKHPDQTLNRNPVDGDVSESEAFEEPLDQRDTAIESAVMLHQPPENEAPAQSSEAGPSGSVQQSKYSIYNIAEHEYPFVLASLNPLTVPVEMLRKETDIVFGK